MRSAAEECRAPSLYALLGSIIWQPHLFEESSEVVAHTRNLILFWRFWKIDYQTYKRERRLCELAQGNRARRLKSPQAFFLMYKIQKS
jgi:hypothetical protein